MSFTSFCGGLPAPEHADGVPLKYKFSWRPEGVLTAALEGAQWLLRSVRMITLHNEETSDNLSELYDTWHGTPQKLLVQLADHGRLPA